MSSHVEIFRPLRSPGNLALTAMYEILDAIAHEEPPYEKVRLSVGFDQIRLPAGWRLTAPVDIEAQDNRFRAESVVHVAASMARGIFPRFEGTLSISPLGDGESDLWLRGNYTVPGGAAGNAIDATVLRGAAARSLRDFITWLAARIEERR